MSITKAVVYLFLGTLVTILLGSPAPLRGKQRPDRRQTVGERIYEIAQVQVAEQGLPTKAIRRWFPYVATLLLFIWVGQHARLHPAAADRRDVARHPASGASTRRRRRSR